MIHIDSCSTHTQKVMKKMLVYICSPKPEDEIQHFIVLYKILKVFAL